MELGRGSPSHDDPRCVEAHTRFLLPCRPAAIGRGAFSRNTSASYSSRQAPRTLGFAGQNKEDGADHDHTRSFFTEGSLMVCSCRCWGSFLALCFHLNVTTQAGQRGEARVSISCSLKPFVTAPLFDPRSLLL